MPDWARGVFSVRFGGSEFKAPSQTATHNATSNGCTGGHADVSAPAGSPLEEPKLETYTGSARRVYGNSSRETGWTAQQHAAAGLPTPWAEHPTGAVLWITGEHCSLQNMTLSGPAIMFPITGTHVARASEHPDMWVNGVLPSSIAEHPGCMLGPWR